MDHDILVDLLCKVSVRFKRLATDYSLWKGHVLIEAAKNPRRAEFVVQECLNSGTKTFEMWGYLDVFYPVLTSPRYADFINPSKRFPKLKLKIFKPVGGDDCLEWVDESISEDEQSEAFREFWTLVDA